MTRATLTLPVEYLHSILRYDPLTGILYWIKPHQGRKLGQPAGGPRPKSYINISIDGKRYLGHRLAWAMHYGDWPDIIDHINNNPVDNCIANLRSGTDRANQQNRPNHRNGKLVGASRCSNVNKWQGRIWVDGRTLHLGHFDTELEAHQAYMDAVETLNKTESGARA